MAIVLALLLFAQGQQPVADPRLEFRFWGYTLEDQNEPEYLALRTPWGTHRIRPDQNCQYIQANQNVRVDGWEGMYIWLLADGEGWQPYCVAEGVGGWMDQTPCFKNDWGDCDVAVENS